MSWILPVVLYAAEVYVTGKSKVCSKHERCTDRQSKDVITDEYDNSTQCLSSCTSSNTYAHTLHANSQRDFSTTTHLYGADCCLWQYGKQNEFERATVPNGWNQTDKDCYANVANNWWEGSVGDMRLKRGMVWFGCSFSSEVAYEEGLCPFQ